ncbi:copper chaperone PCu(A)C [Deinococcus deserti]|uniref:Copper chaperone PCu(A)C n=1 Tax=Deinococcus deserti (strain DSM 17065 / CIP 109153 / LMG 22923 / VCD115) TaxID=546414 RepID=C1CZX3_DEIDV|nr:copper chaperone PCu(A)C [Deinococcus deserti]ACO45225.1 Conserved hypothetical protein, precursor [Deinococcus deserti VCD115]
MFPRIFLALCASLLFLALPVAAGHAAHGSARTLATVPAEIKVVSTRVLAVPPGIRDTSAFISLRNPGARPLVLKAAHTPLAAHSMLMVTHKDAAGRTGMKEVKRLNIPARGTLLMGPSGTHLMVMGLKRAVKVGEKLPFTLSFSDGRTLKVSATVYKP